MKLPMTLANALLATAFASHAQMSPDTKMPAASPPAAAPPAVLTDGVVQQVDAKTGVVALKHGDIANMKMPAMTSRAMVERASGTGDAARRDSAFGARHAAGCVVRGNARRRADPAAQLHLCTSRGHSSAVQRENQPPNHAAFPAARVLDARCCAPARHDRRAQADR